MTKKQAVLAEIKERLQIKTGWGRDEVLALIEESFEKIYYERQSKPILGQEAVCPDGLGRVVGVGKDYIKVSTYVNDRECNWDPKNITLVSFGSD